MNKDLTDEQILANMDIDSSSLFNLEKELKEHPKRGAIYVRLLKESINIVNIRKLELEILTAELVNKYVKQLEEAGKPVSIYAHDKVIKTILPMDESYQNMRKIYNEAVEKKIYLDGLVKAWKDRGFRLKELVQLEHDILISGENNVREDRRRLNTRMRSAASKLEVPE